MSSASSISASGISLAPASTMRMASSVPATTRSRSVLPTRSASLGLTTKLPSILPMRTAPTGVGERDRREHQRRGGAVHREDVVGMDVIDAQRHVHQLRLEVPALREERADRAVDHARGQRALLARATLALEERAGDLARGVHALLDIHRQREEVDVAEVADGRGAEDHRVALADDDRAGGLPGHLAGLERDLACRRSRPRPWSRRHCSYVLPFLARPSVGGPIRLASRIPNVTMVSSSSGSSGPIHTVGVAVAPARSASWTSRLTRSAISGPRRSPRSGRGRGRGARSAPTGAGRRGGPGRRRARRASSQNAPCGAAASAACASATARWCLAFRAKWRNVSRTRARLEAVRRRPRTWDRRSRRRRGPRGRRPGRGRGRRRAGPGTGRRCAGRSSA